MRCTIGANGGGPVKVDGRDDAGVVKVGREGDGKDKENVTKQEESQTI